MKLIKIFMTQSYVVPAVAFTAALVFLLDRSLLHGGAQSFDAMLYARSLWGLGHGDLFNSVLQENSLYIHGHLLLVVLSPLTHLTSAINILIYAQSIALGVSVALVTKELLRQHNTSEGILGQLKMLPLSIFFGALSFLGSPLILNPFLFDVHPGLLGVPFCIAGLLRAVHLGGVDKRVLIFLLLSILAREEFALVAAGGILFHKKTRDDLWPLRRRAVIAFFLVAYYGIYWIVARGFTLSSAQLLLTGGGQNNDIKSTIFTKSVILSVFVTSIGGWVLCGWRWLGATAFGLCFLLWNCWLPEGQIRFQYSMFVAPGLLAAGVAGYQYILKKGIIYRIVAISLSIVVALSCFSIASAWPGGGQFQATNFSMSTQTGGIDWNVKRQHSLTEQAYRQLRAVPLDDGLSVPYSFGAAVADRKVIWPNFKLVAYIQKHDTVPDDIQSVVLFRTDLPTAGRYLVKKEGFRIVTSVGPLVHLQRK